MIAKNVAMVLPIILVVIAACQPAAPPLTTPEEKLPEPVKTVGATPVSVTELPDLVDVSVFFTDSKSYARGSPPFEQPGTRLLDPGQSLPQAVLLEFFKGPTKMEQSQGLERITSGFTGLRDLVIQDGIAHVYLDGPCQSMGATYTIAQPLMANLRQFPEIRSVKIYDAEGETWDPEGPDSSIPPCLEP
jgi:hypothetical protein